VPVKKKSVLSFSGSEQIYLSEGWHMKEVRLEESCQKENFYQGFLKLDYDHERVENTVGEMQVDVTCSVEFQSKAQHEDDVQYFLKQQQGQEQCQITTSPNPEDAVNFADLHEDSYMVFVTADADSKIESAHIRTVGQADEKAPDWTLPLSVAKEECN